MEDMALTIAAQLGDVQQSGITVAGTAFAAGIVLFGIGFIITYGIRLFLKSKGR